MKFAGSEVDKFPYKQHFLPGMLMAMAKICRVTPVFQDEKPWLPIKSHKKYRDESGSF